jgi:uncharacterized protein (DUF4415 family)
MKTSNAKSTVRISKPVALTAEQKAELAALKNLPDSSIDYSDIPPLGEEFWKSAVQGKFYRPTKTSTTMRLDDDVLFWLRSKGRGYQTRVNAILRDAMLHEVRKV